MIIENGILNSIGKTGGGYESGSPVPVGETLGKDIPCNISTPHSQRHDNKTGEGSTYSTASYTLLVELPRFDAQEVVLTNSRGDCLGRCRVQSVQYLDSVGAIRIIVERYADYENHK